MSDNDPTVYERLATAQQQCGKLVKNAINPHFKNKYADLGAILDLIREPVANNGLALYQTTTIQDGRMCLTTTVVAGNGIIESTAYLPNVDDPQKIGSAISYYRRYHLVSLFCLNAEDDDGNEASRPAPKQDAPKPTNGTPMDLEKWSVTVNQAAVSHDINTDKKAWGKRFMELGSQAVAWKSPEHIQKIVDAVDDEAYLMWLKVQTAEAGIRQ